VCIDQGLTLTATGQWLNNGVKMRRVCLFSVLERNVQPKAFSAHILACLSSPFLGTIFPQIGHSAISTFESAAVDEDEVETFFLPAGVLLLEPPPPLAVAFGGLPGDLAGDFAFEALTGVDFLLAGL